METNNNVVMETFVAKLKFDNKASFEAWKLSEAENADIITVVEIGVITQPATYDGEGNELTPETQIEGYHADVMSTAIITSLQPFVIAPPEHPVHGRVWAEWSTIVLPQ